MLLLPLNEQENGFREIDKSELICKVFSLFWPTNQLMPLLNLSF